MCPDEGASIVICITVGKPLKVCFSPQPFTFLHETQIGGVELDLFVKMSQSNLHLRQTEMLGRAEESYLLCGLGATG